MQNYVIIIYEAKFYNKKWVSINKQYYIADSTNIL